MIALDARRLAGASDFKHHDRDAALRQIHRQGESDRTRADDQHAALDRSCCRRGMIVHNHSTRSLGSRSRLPDKRIDASGHQENSAVGFRRAVEPGIACLSFRIRIPGSADQDHRDVSARRQRRYRDPCAAAPARGGPAPDHRDREQGRGRRQHRNGGGGSGCRRRLYARCRRSGRADGQSTSQPRGDVVRSGQGSRAGHPACRNSLRAGGVAGVGIVLGRGRHRGREDPFRRNCRSAMAATAPPCT